ncbi:MAG: hypothetical protein H0X45_00370 [Planctomycetes bacterium]|nr:hypothetical protein [Planctomycetota bacterium]
MINADNSDVLTEVAARCAAGLTPAHPVATYLATNGVSDPAVWSAFRLGVADLSVSKGIDNAGRAVFTQFGSAPAVYLPTIDPRHPDLVVGFVRQRLSDNGHEFTTAPAGIACTADLANHDCVVLTDAPLLALRLVQAGVRGVALAEDNAVLPPLLDWLATRRLVIATYRWRTAKAMQIALGPLGVTAVPVFVQTRLERSSLATLQALGLSPDRVGREIIPVSIDASPILLRDLMTFARRQLNTAAAVAALVAIGFELPDLVNAYGFGFVPAGYRDAISSHDLGALAHLDLSGAVVVPAFDDGGIIIDILAVRTDGTTVSVRNPADGLLGHRIVSAFDELVVVDDLRDLVALFRAGQRNVLLMRGLSDVQRNADRLARSGVRMAEVRCIQADEIAGALRAVGIETRVGSRTSSVPEALAQADDSVALPVAAADLLELVERNDATQSATYRVGSIVYVVEIPIGDESTLEVKVRAHGRVQGDRIDLAVPAQRQRFAANVARLGVAAVAVEQHLIALLDAVRQLQVPVEASAPVAVSNDDEDTALSLLRSPDLLDRIATDLEALGWPGEREAKRLLYLASISRKLPDPVWALISGSPAAGRPIGLDLIAELTPPEDLVHRSRLTGAALYYQEPGALSHKLLVLDVADALSPDVVMALRVLEGRGALSMSHVERGPAGTARTHQIEARGPVSVLTTMSDRFDSQLKSRCCILAIDESPEQTARVLADQRRMRADGRAAAWRRAIVHRHHALQRLLVTRPVVIPYAERIQFPATAVHHRGAQERFLRLIEASALLHQHQRLDDGEHIVADVADFDLIVRLMGDVAGEDEGCRPQALELLDAVRAAGRASFTINDLEPLRPTWTRHAFRASLDELLEHGLLVSPRGGRGHLRSYQVAAVRAAPITPRARLLDAKVGELAEVGETPLTNFTPEADTG